MLSLLFAAGALLIAVVIGLGRQITVFTVFEPGLWIFRRFPLKRNIGLVLCGTHKPHPLLPDKEGIGVGGQV